MRTFLLKEGHFVESSLLVFEGAEVRVTTSGRFYVIEGLTNLQIKKCVCLKYLVPIISWRSLVCFHSVRLWDSGQAGCSLSRVSVNDYWTDLDLTAAHFKTRLVSVVQSWETGGGSAALWGHVVRTPPGSFYFTFWLGRKLRATISLSGTSCSIQLQLLETGSSPVQPESDLLDTESGVAAGLGTELMTNQKSASLTFRLPLLSHQAHRDVQM